VAIPCILDFFYSSTLEVGTASGYPTMDSGYSMIDFRMFDDDFRVLMMTSGCSTTASGFSVTTFGYSAMVLLDIYIGYKTTQLHTDSSMANAKS
jgi:hypothetical protein